LGTLTGHSPPVRTFGEHFLFVVADISRAVSGHRRRNSGQRPRSQKAHRPAPIGPGPPARDAYIVGYYVCCVSVHQRSPDRARAEVLTSEGRAKEDGKMRGPTAL
jgi:hypothetical protein